MSKFMILYNSQMSSSEQMTNASPEEMKASMEEWISWKNEVSKTVNFDFGLPLQIVNKLTSNEITAGDSHVSGYSIMEGESKDVIVNMLKSHPHLKQAGASIDVLEMLHMPGM